jgi:hypothetical protein
MAAAKKSILAKLEAMEAANLRAAEILLADPDRYPGLPQIWAEMFLARRRGGKVVPTQNDEGRYLVRITNQCFTSSKQKGTLGFVLTFRPVRRLDRPESPAKPFQRDTTLWITDRTLKRVLHQLHELGYEGADLKGVDPDTKGFHDFRDLEIELTCSHEPGSTGEIYEQWSFESSQQNLADKTLLRHFDRLLNSEKEAEDAPPESRITADQVPF